MTVGPGDIYTVGSLLVALTCAIAAFVLAVKLSSNKDDDVAETEWEPGAHGWVVINNLATCGRMTLMRVGTGRFVLYRDGQRTEEIRAFTIDAAIAFVMKREEMAA